MHTHWTDSTIGWINFGKSLGLVLSRKDYCVLSSEWPFFQEKFNNSEHNNLYVKVPDREILQNWSTLLYNYYYLPVTKKWNSIFLSRVWCSFKCTTSVAFADWQLYSCLLYGWNSMLTSLLNHELMNYFITFLQKKRKPPTRLRPPVSPSNLLIISELEQIFSLLF